MSGHEELLARRARLVERAEAERAQLAALVGEWEKPLRIFDQSVAIVRRLRSSSLFRVVAGAGMAALAFARPRSVLGLVHGGQAIWKLIRKARTG